MIQNVGSIDRALRAVLGIVLLGFALLSALPVFDVAIVKFAVTIVGCVMLVVTWTRVCPVYSIFGFKTCRIMM